MYALKISEEEKVRASKIAENAGASMVKTTTGVKTQYLCGDYFKI